MSYVFIILSALFSVVSLFLLTKLIGVRQVSQLSMFDYINGITIGSIAAQMAVSEFPEVFRCLIALVVYCVAGTVLAKLCEHFLPVRRLVEGKTKLLLKNGRLYDCNFRKASLTINEFLVAAREAGYFSLSDVDTAILEPNGRISFLPNAAARPVTPRDLSLTPEAELLAYNVIQDSVVMYENLKTAGYNEIFLSRALSQQGYSSAEGVFLATLTRDGVLSVFPKTKPETQKKKTGLE